jgi:hypothetical protein
MEEFPVTSKLNLLVKLMQIIDRRSFNEKDKRLFKTRYLSVSSTKFHIDVVMR